MFGASLNGTAHTGTFNFILFTTYPAYLCCIMLFIMFCVFHLFSATGEVYINSDPSLEFTQIMYMTICVSERRNEVCGNLTIEFRKWRFC